MHVTMSLLVSYVRLFLHFFIAFRSSVLSIPYSLLLFLPSNYTSLLGFLSLSSLYSLFSPSFPSLSLFSIPFPLSLHFFFLLFISSFSLSFFPSHLSLPSPFPPPPFPSLPE